jgi:1-deoxyxylulose-5-phosphate synthase
MTFGLRATEATALDILDVADGAGITFIDTADVYPPTAHPALRGRAEEIVGRWQRTRKDRHRVVLATKVGKPMGGRGKRGLRRAHILRACEDSLRRLQTEYLDLYQLHTPDSAAPIDETLRALEDLVQAGKVRHVGCSNVPVPEFVEALAASDDLGLQRFVSHQVRYNLVWRDIEAGLLPLCQAYQVGVVAYSPLDGGGLTDDRVARAATPGALTELRHLAATRGLSLTHVALAWAVSRAGVASTIVGASRPDQLEDSLSAVGLVLDEELRSACDDLGQRAAAYQEVVQCA